MRLLGKLEIKSKEKIIEFLSSQQTGRISSIDENGYPTNHSNEFCIYQ